LPARAGAELVGAAHKVSVREGGRVAIPRVEVIAMRPLRVVVVVDGGHVTIFHAAACGVATHEYHSSRAVTAAGYARRCANDGVAV